MTTDLNRINGKIPTWATKTRGEHAYYQAAATAHGVGPASYGRRSADIVCRVAQRPTDGVYVVDVAFQPPYNGAKPVRQTGECGTLADGKALTVELVPQVAETIRLHHSPSSAPLADQARIQWSSTP